MMKAFTLIECMIAVAVLTLVVSVAMVAPQAPLLEAEDVVVKERVRQWLDYEAAVVDGGADPAVERALQELVPQGALSKKKQNGLTTLTVTWRRPNGRAGSHSLVVAGGAS